MSNLLRKLDGWISEIVDHLVEAVDYWTGLRRTGQLRGVAVCDVVFVMIWGFLEFDRNKDALVFVVIHAAFCGCLMWRPQRMATAIEHSLRIMRVILVAVVGLYVASDLVFQYSSWDHVLTLGSHACVILILYIATSHDPRNKSRLKQMVSALIPSGNPQVNLDPIKS